jgi:PKD repeat protein
VQFTDLSGNVTGWNWDFGDGASSTLQNPTHTYSTAGNYTVNLTVSNENGTDSKLLTINVSKKTVKPVANFTSDVTSGKAPLNVSFTDTSTGIPVLWRWTFGDATNSTIQNPIHMYSKAGNYTVALTVANAAGNNQVIKAAYIDVTAATKPFASFTSDVTSGKAPLNVSFTDSSTGTPVLWRWTFGDGTNSTVQNPIHMYSKAGNYTVVFTVGNQAGTSKVIKTGYINAK